MIYRILLLSTLLVSGLFSSANANSNKTLPTDLFELSLTQNNSSEVEDTLLRVPSAFMPHTRREMNGMFRVIYQEPSLQFVGDFEMFVYDRRGTLVFQSDDINKGWDGKYKDKFCPVGAYVYIIRYTIITNSGGVVPHEKKGTVLLVE